MFSIRTKGRTEAIVASGDRTARPEGPGPCLPVPGEGTRENVAGVPLDEYQRNRGTDPVKGPDAAKVFHLQHPKI